tara:strand:+ start:28658 stop:28954 length:297 start_codon:yes stop_codon:yes gene_type:complete
MNKLVGLLTLCVVCAILQAALAGLVVAMILALLWSFITQPRDTILFLATCALSCVAVARPMACIIALGVISVAVVVAGVRRKPRRPLLLIGRGPGSDG